MIEIFKDRKGEYRFRVKSRNGKILCQSEGYTRKLGAERGISALRKVMEEPDVFEL